MKSALKFSLLGAVLVAAGLAYAQGPMSGQCDAMGGSMPGMQGMRHERMGKMDPARMQALLERRHAALKSQLKITAEQEAAWRTYTEAFKPGAAMANHPRPDPVEMAKLTTPERLDKMQALRAQRMGDMSAAMEQHTQATKALYAALTPEQQKLFDAATGPGQHRAMGQRKGPRGAGPMMNQPS